MDSTRSARSIATSASTFHSNSTTDGDNHTSDITLDRETDPGTLNSTSEVYGEDDVGGHKFSAIARPHGWRGIVEDFVPQWFSINMGTGIVSILLFNVPYPYMTEPSGATHPMWMVWLSTAAFLVNIVLFVLILVAGVLRYTTYPKAMAVVMRHPVQSHFLGTFPVAFSTLGVSFSSICVIQLGWGGPSGWAEMLGWAMFWVDAVLAVAVALGVTYLMVTSHRLSLPQQSSTMLLPIIAPIVASAQGAVVASSLSNPHYAVTTVMVSLVIWGIGVPTAMMVLVLYFQRLALYKLPSKEVIVSIFLPLGPIGQGGFAIQKLGLVAKDVFPRTGILDPIAGHVFYILGFLVACVLWGFGILWLFFAATTVLWNRFPFNMSWWSFTFPLGVYAMSTISMGKDMPSTTFSVLGEIFAIAVILLWMLVSVLTLKHALRSKLFFASQELQKDHDVRPKEIHRRDPNLHECEAGEPC